MKGRGCRRKEGDPRLCSVMPKVKSGLPFDGRCQGARGDDGPRPRGFKRVSAMEFRTIRSRPEPFAAPSAGLGVGLGDIAHRFFEIIVASSSPPFIGRRRYRRADAGPMPRRLPLGAMSGLQRKAGSKARRYSLISMIEVQVISLTILPSFSGQPPFIGTVIRYGMLSLKGIGPSGV
ncbi:hypothetical protein EV132_110156 [Rhizobium sullae]|uniref:Uncharacterized protein n=1 Tax=Rhizobium sullae TaxID=50338 RepID=A0A4R3Q0H1_RHISU|nr:hypothetical protein EV132_110156 [Rhizobium sullae]